MVSSKNTLAMKRKRMILLLSMVMLSISMSQAQPQKLKDHLSSVDYEFEALGKFYFYYFRSDSLWQSDGTPEGTIVVKDLNQGYFIKGSVYKTNDVFFFATYVTNQVTLWKSNGTNSGTVVLATYTNIQPVGIQNNELYYLAVSGGTSSLYKVAATGSPVTVKSLSYTYQSINANYPTVPILNSSIAGGYLYFSLLTNPSPRRWDLWRTNGTSSGTTIAIASSFFEFHKLTEFNGSLYFENTNGMNENAELWKTNGTLSSTTLVKKFERKSNIVLIKYQNKLYVLAAPTYDYPYFNRGSYLYETDGTSEGTIVITQFPIAQITTFAGIVNGQMAFLNGFDNSETTQYSAKIYRSDGTNKGTILVKTLNTSAPYFYQYIPTRPNDYLVVGNYLFFESHQYDHYGDGASYLIQTDLTPEGTKSIESLYPSYPAQNSYNGLTNVNNVLYFRSFQPGGYKLWKYNPVVPVDNTPYFTLVNAATDQDLKWLKDGDTIVKYPGDQINIRYNPAETVGGIKFTLNGGTPIYENVAPYALAGDNNGDYNPWNTSSAGNYTLIAQKYSSHNGNGTLLGTTTINFHIRTVTPGQPPVSNAGTDQYIPLPATSASLVGSASDPDGSIASISWSFVYGPDTYSELVSFSNPNALTTTVSDLLHAGEYVFRLTVTDNSGLTTSDDIKVTITGQAVNSIYLLNSNYKSVLLSDGQVLDLSALTNECTFVVTTNPPVVGSVRITYDAITRTENEAPYSAFGDSPPYNWHSLTNGTHTITATPYTGSNATGTAGISQTLTFTIVNALRSSSDNYSSTLVSDALLCYPNPSTGLFNISIPVDKEGPGTVLIYDVNGALITTLFDGPAPSGSTLDLQWQSKNSGIYFLKTKIGEKEYNQKLVVY